MLLAHHRAEWLKSSVSEEIIALNVQSIEDGQELKKFLNYKPKDRYKHLSELCPGWAVSGTDLDTFDRTLSGAQFKSDSPRRDKDGKIIKYESSRGYELSPLFLEMPDREFWPKVERSTEVIWICEGAKKAGSLLSLGFAAISLPGVWNGQKEGELRPELKRFCKTGRIIALCFDSDILEKTSVQKALDRLGRLLCAEGCVVKVIQIPAEQKGIDDFISAGGDAAQLYREAIAFEKWRKQTKERQEREPTTVIEIPCKMVLRYQEAHAKLNKRCRWNELNSEIEIDGESVEDEDLHLFLALRCNLSLPKGDVSAIVKRIAQENAYNPIKDYLTQCAARYPADDQLLDNLAAKSLGVQGELYSCYLRKTLISAVARVLNPGCKVDTVLILHGAQDAGKSSFFRELASPDWFDDSFKDVANKDELLKLHQVWFIEWAELEQVFKRRDISTVKAFITTQEDMIRPPYAKSVKKFKRPSIIVGSTNEDEFLGDTTGNRRYWIIPNVDRVDLTLIRAQRDRIWAAAYHAFKSGESWKLPQSLKQASTEATSEFSFGDPWEKVVLQYAQEMAYSDGIEVSDILTHGLKLGLSEQDKRAEMRVTSILKRGGWDSKRLRRDGKRLRLWIPPENQNSSNKVVPVVPVGTDEPEAITNGHPEVSQPLSQPPPLSQPEVGTPSPTDQGVPLAQPGQPFPQTFKNQKTADPLNPIDPYGNPIKDASKVAVLLGTAIWKKTSSTPLEKKHWIELPTQFKGKGVEEIPISAFPLELQQEYQEDHEVLGCCLRGVHIRNLKTKRISYINPEGIGVLSHANG